MSAPLIFVRDGRTLPFIPVTTAALDAIRDALPKRRPCAVATYVALLEFANESRADRVLVAQREIVEHVGASRTTIQAALADLEVAGVLEVVKRVNDRARVENEYVLVEPANICTRAPTPARQTSDPRPSDEQPLKGLEELLEEKKEEIAKAISKKSATSQDVSDVDAVWLHYVELMKPRRSQPSEQERRVIRDALEVATVDELRDVVTSCERSDFHMRRRSFAAHPPGPGRKYNKLTDMFRARRGGKTLREHIDYFLDKLAEDAGTVPSGSNARVQTARRSVLAAWEFPGDELVVRQGEEAAVWLAQQGWIVLRDGPNGRPRFEPKRG